MTPEKYLEHVHALIDGVRSNLSEGEVSEVLHLVNHDEPAEGLRALAWIIHDEEKRVSPEVVGDILTLIDGMVSEEDLPPNFKYYGASDS